MKINMEVEFSEFNRAVKATTSELENLGYIAARKAAKEIYKGSQQRVPDVTGTLRSSGYYKVNKTSGGYQAEVGYGGNGDPVNPVSRVHASQYMVKVHEDLFAFHPHGGEAKFLENAVTQYQEDNDSPGGFFQTVKDFVKRFWS